MGYRYKEAFPASALIERVLKDNPESSDSHRSVANLLGLQMHTVQQWRIRNTKFRPFIADRYAVAAGYHPCEVWGELWWDSSLTEPVRR